MPKIRSSYSFLHQWEQGKISEALLSYFHVPRPTPPNYSNGRKWDEYCTAYITKHSKLPPEWGGDLLEQPVVQLKTLVGYNALSSLTGVYDIYDKKTKTLYELKSGHSLSARRYAGTMQIPLYLLVAHLADIPIKQVVVIRYNPRTDSQDRCLLYPGVSIIKKAQNYLDSLIPEIHQYFMENNLFELTDTQASLLLNSV